MSTHEHEYLAETTYADLGRPAWSACIVCHEPPVICAVCGDPTPTSVPIHDGCLEREHAVLDDIAAVVASWPEPIREILTAVAYDLTGVMSVDDKARLPFGLDAVTDDWFHQAAGVRTVPGALDVLDEWVQAWTDAGAGATDGELIAVNNPIAYLRSRLVWAATNPARSGFADYRTEARTLRHRLRDLDSSRPDRVEGALCLSCGGHLAYARQQGVLDTLATCERCGLAFDVVDISRTRRARIALAPNQAPGALVTEPEARRIFAELGTSTIRQWINRGRLAAAGSRHGSATYRVRDITALARPAYGGTIRPPGSLIPAGTSVLQIRYVGRCAAGHDLYEIDGVVQHIITADEIAARDLTKWTCPNEVVPPAEVDTATA